jgi:V8-like Glu-specific endopeptidase
MKIIRDFSLFILLLIIVGTSVFANPLDKVIYGADDRVFVEDHKSEKVKEMGKAVAAMLPISTIDFSFGGALAELQAQLLSDWGGVCPSDPFHASLVAGTCSGFLVAPDVLVTAGHCIKSIEDCENNYWYFQLQDSYLYSREKNYLDAGALYQCGEIIDRGFHLSKKIDFAIVRLKRSVPNVAPLKFRMTGKVEEKEPLFIMGHPMGLPKIAAGNAFVMDSSEPGFFRASLDSFQGNSGSPVINAATFEVEGILVRGEYDYSFNEDLGCQELHFCDREDDCEGEEATKITTLEKLYTL